MYGEKEKIQKREYYLKYRVEILKKRSEYVEKNRELLKERDRRKYAQNEIFRKKCLDYQKQYRAENKKKTLDYAREYRLKFKDIVNDRVRTYRQTPEGRHSQREKQRKRYSLLKFANDIGNHSRDEWEELLKKCGRKCKVCGSSKDITKDHIVAISKGGNNEIRNIQPLCRSCNSRKRNK